MDGRHHHPGAAVAALHASAMRGDGLHLDDLAARIRALESENDSLRVEIGVLKGDITDNNERALRAAAAAGAVEGVMRLLRTGIDPDAPDAYCRTALHRVYADGAGTEYEREAIMHHLLAAGADPSSQDDTGRTAADYADESGYAAHAEKLREADDATRAADDHQAADRAAAHAAGVGCGNGYGR